MKLKAPKSGKPSKSGMIGGQFCKGRCNAYHAILLERSGKKYDNNGYCKRCNKWMPKDKIILSGIYHRCPCCNMKVRMKRFTSLSTREK